MKPTLTALVLTLFFTHLSLLAERESISIAREDGTIIEGYFDRPQGETDAPVVIFIDGSHKASVMASHEKLAERLNPRNIGLISLEKRGITPTVVDEQEFSAHDCFEERLSDYTLLLQHLQDKKINSQIILLGGSEGGKIVPRLTLISPTKIQGAVLIASGGGLPFGEEMKYQLKRRIYQKGWFWKFGYKIRRLIFPGEVDRQYARMLNEPQSLQTYRFKTWKWFASYLQYDPLPDLLKIDFPIYMIHGEKDICVPIQSADLLKAAFDQAGKTNLHYARYTDLEHSLTGRDDVYAPLLEWIEKRVEVSSSLGESS